jgi:hypothetical protein
LTAISTAKTGIAAALILLAILGADAARITSRTTSPAPRVTATTTE